MLRVTAHKATALVANQRPECLLLIAQDLETLPKSGRELGGILLWLTGLA
jgi:hypothetical protein